MRKKLLGIGLLLALSCASSVSFGAADESAATIAALTQLADEYAATKQASELDLTLQKLAILREEWEALDRPEASPAQVAASVATWRAEIAKQLTPKVNEEGELEEVVGKLAYPNEFNGSTLKDHEVVITFDDGPHPKLTPIIHGIVKDAKIPAAFFELGENIKNNSKLTQGLAAEGYVIGDHSWDHPNLTTLADAQVEKQINDTQAEIDTVLGGKDNFNTYFQTFFAQFFMMPEKVYAPEFFRSPYGGRSERTMDIILNTQVGEYNATENGKSVVKPDTFFHIMWNVDSLDWQDPDPASIEKRVFDQLATYGHHGIILFHDIHPQTVPAIQLILPRLAKEGYKCVSLYQMLEEVEQKEENLFGKR
jgi:peptidoglycan/xylan/chitin deacetylase (PgdA/CDA1 family)